MFTKEQVNLYLKRIGLEGPMPLCRETLDRIIFAHYQHIPYENLDTMNGIPVLLSEEALFDKIVCRNRGGWCFELNAALTLLLQGMGFEVTLLAARFLAGEDPKVIPLRRHEVLLVTLPDGQYLCDAGIMRESCRRALKLEYGLIQSDGNLDTSTGSHCTYVFSSDHTYTARGVDVNGNKIKENGTWELNSDKQIVAGKYTMGIDESGYLLKDTGERDGKGRKMKYAFSKVN